MSSSSIPEPRLLVVTNRTPFPLFQCDKMGVGRRFYDTVVLKGTFVLAPGKLALAEEQVEIAFADEPWDPDDAEVSSLKIAGDVVLMKPSTDVIVTGTARAPGGEPLARWEASVEVRRGEETKIACRANVLGRHAWRHTAEKGWTLSEPEPTVEVPIRYDFAYGGAYPAVRNPDDPLSPKWIVHAQNPSGIGFFEEDALDTEYAYPAPQWQSPAHSPVTTMNREVPVSGFGPVARSWSSRLKYAGTYDDAWMRKAREDAAARLPADYPADFDPRFFQCAHPEMIAPSYLVGDEEVTLTGLLGGASPLTFQLPCLRVTASLVDGQGVGSIEDLPLDTVHIDVDKETVCLLFRMTLDQARDVRAALFVLTEAP